MSGATLLTRARAEGVLVSLSATGGLRAKGSRAAVDRWLPVLREHKPEIVSALSANDRGLRRRWLIGFAGCEPMELICADPVTAADVRRLYPTAASVEPGPIAVKRDAADAEAAELAALISAVLPNGTAEDREEALCVALADPDAALICFRTLAKAAAR